MPDDIDERRAKGILFYDIPSLRPPEIPVTQNRVLRLKLSALTGGRNEVLLRAGQQRELFQKPSGNFRAQQRRVHADLQRAYRSMDNLCTQLWVRQTRLYAQLCDYHNKKRESRRETYKLEQERLRLLRHLPEELVDEEMGSGPAQPAKRKFALTASPIYLPAEASSFVSDNPDITKDATNLFVQRRYEHYAAERD